MITYESICEKLGCRIEDFKFQLRKDGSSDDNAPNIFGQFTMEELAFITEYIEANNIDIGFEYI